MSYITTYHKKKLKISSRKRKTTNVRTFKVCVLVYSQIHIGILSITTHIVMSVIVFFLHTYTPHYNKMKIDFNVIESSRKMLGNFYGNPKKREAHSPKRERERITLELAIRCANSHSIEKLIIVFNQLAE